MKDDQRFLGCRNDKPVGMFDSGDSSDSDEPGLASWHPGQRQYIPTLAFANHNFALQAPLGALGGGAFSDGPISYPEFPVTCHPLGSGG
jgi:hypothetical protein